MHGRDVPLDLRGRNITLTGSFFHDNVRYRTVFGGGKYDSRISELVEGGLC
jgi:hypothetical protein